MIDSHYIKCGAEENARKLTTDWPSQLCAAGEVGVVALWSPYVRGLCGEWGDSYMIEGRGSSLCDC